MTMRTERELEMDGMPEGYTARYQGHRGTPDPEPGLEWREYRKTATTRAIQVEWPFVVETEEGEMRGDRGDYLAEGPAGERWPIKREIFEATYVPVDEPVDEVG